MDLAFLFENAYRDGPSCPHILQGYAYSVFVAGNLAGATLRIQLSPDGQIWLDMPGAAYTSETVENLDMAAQEIRAVLSGAGPDTSVTVALRY